MPPQSQAPRHRQRQRVAIVGSGLAGLATAYLLVQEGAEVWLIDKAPRLGFHAWSVELSSENKGKKGNALALDLASTPARQGRVEKEGEKEGGDETHAVDVPMRSFQGGYYPLLIALYRHLGLSMSPADFTFSFTSLRGSELGDTYFIHSGSSGASIPSIPRAAWDSPVAFGRAVISLLSVGVCYLILLVISFLSWHRLLPSTNFRQLVDSTAARLERPVPFLSKTPLGRAFKTFAADIVLPLFSAVGTMTADDVWDTRANVLLDYIHAGVGTSHYTLGGGRSARDVASLLAAPVRAQGEDHVRLGEAINGITYSSEGELVLSLGEGEDEISVDRVVLATQASAARALLSSLEPSLSQRPEEARRVARMRSALEDVHYRDTIVVTHRDHSVLPADVRDINLVQPPPISDEGASDAPTPELGSAPSSAPTSPCPGTPNLEMTAPHFPPSAGYTMATHVVAPPGVEPVLQTTNPVMAIDADAVLGVARLERALPLADDTTIQRLRPSNEGRMGKPLVFLAGSYAYPGIPLLEGCVGSARRAVDDMMGKPAGKTGGVDWDAGRGGLIGRAWRWRWNRLGGY